MAVLVSLRWNQLYPSLLFIAEELEKLGFTYHQGKVMVVKPEEAQECLASKNAK